MVAVFRDVDQRWRVLVPLDTVVVSGTRRQEAIAELRALPPATNVAIVGGRRLRRVARRAGVVVRAQYVALPSLATPVAITQVVPESLRWTTRTVLTVPSGVTGKHLPLWLGVRLMRALPRLLSLAPQGDRLLVGTRS